MGAESSVGGLMWSVLDHEAAFSWALPELSVRLIHVELRLLLEEGA